VSNKKEQGFQGFSNALENQVLLKQLQIEKL
jgi:hypothetical protein